jgi:hypothetical protein
MAEAQSSVHLAKLHASMSLATNPLARQRALKAAKHQLQAQGLRVSQFSHRDLLIRADAYLAEHREELIAEAREIVLRWQAEGFFGKRAKLLSDAQGGKT